MVRSGDPTNLRHHESPQLLMFNLVYKRSARVPGCVPRRCLSGICLAPAIGFATFLAFGVRKRLLVYGSAVAYRRIMKISMSSPERGFGNRQVNINLVPGISNRSDQGPLGIHTLVPGFAPLDPKKL